MGKGPMPMYLDAPVTLHYDLKDGTITVEGVVLVASRKRNIERATAALKGL